MSLSRVQFRLLLLLCWVGCVVAAWALVASDSTPMAWDLAVYQRALVSLRAGHDPYADGVARQVAFHATPDALNPKIMPPYTYVYSPLTLPLLRLLVPVPFPVLAAVYWVVFVVALMLSAWAIAYLAEEPERRWFAFLAIFLVYFPGLLQANVVLSGNVVFVLYAAVLLTAVHGWRSGKWTAFYAAVLLTSCFKAPLLSLVMIAPFSRRGEWWRTGVTCAIGAALFAVQPLLFPQLFQNYLKAVNLQFVYNADFGFSPSGLLGMVLYAYGKSYAVATTVFYALYAPVVFGVLFVLSRRYFAGRFSLQQWIPVLLLGVVLLNPRVKEYDMALLSLPMAAILWRAAMLARTQARALVIFIATMLSLNLITGLKADAWMPLDGLLLIVFFVLGAVVLFRQQKTASHAIFTSPTPTLSETPA